MRLHTAEVPMLKKVAIGFVAVVVILLVVIATRPARFHIERSASIAAPPEVVFALVNDFDQWPQWSPWEKIDPAMQREVAGPDSGVGATYHWSGNDNVGEGRMTITESKPPERIAIRLEFYKPWTATNQARFSFKPGAGGTQVTWAMDGNNDFMGKAVSLVIDTDSLIGKSFEEGLTAMKTAAESQAKKSAALVDAHGSAGRG